ncbi:MAG: carbon monoxide dehydrogenase subunit G [Planctomycetes bacterium]|nr:carbon monoxide dehydrogenase subunit G [Planctomycetota bacterium]
MKIDGEYLMPGSRARVFALLVDPAVLQRCVPGCKRLEREADHRYVATLEVGIGSVKGLFEGSVELAEQVPPERLVMLVEGKGKPGFAKGKGSVRLEALPDDAGGAPLTRVVYEGEVQVGGTIASVGQRMIQGASKVMAGQFFASLEAEAKVAAEAAARAAASAANPEAPPLPPPLPPKHGPVRAFGRWLWSLLRGLFRR